MYTKHGWWFPTQDTHFCEMLNKNIAKGNKPVYQEPVRKRSLRFVKETKVALDIGANIGLWSRDLCDTFDKVIAFEPVDDFRHCLEKNVVSRNLEIMPCALGNKNTKIDMIITEGNTGHSHVNPNTVGKGQIDMFKLDYFNYGRVDYIKIDCEGYEKFIIQGAEKTIMTHKPVIVIEQKLHVEQGITNQTQYDCVAMLKSWGAKEVDRVRNDCVLAW